MKRKLVFERAMLGLLVGCVAAYTGFVIQNPVERKAAISNPALLAEAYEAAAVITDAGKALAPRPVEVVPLTKNDPSQALNYSLAPVSTGETVVPRIFLTSLPGEIDKVRETAERKKLFFKSVLPLVLQVNEEIAKDRKRLWDIRFRRNLGLKIDALDRLWLDSMAEQYGVRHGDIDGLLARVDIIPPSLALAQAAEESGWGRSRFAKEGNALFGQWTYSAQHKGIKPSERDEGATHRIRAFDNLAHSVRAYMQNLNSHRAYRGLRKMRQQMRAKGSPLDGFLMAGTLTRYSARGENYVMALRSIMEVNGLAAFDDARLHGANLPKALRKPFI